MEAITAGLYRVVMRARETVSLPREKGTMLRGGFGVALKRSVCAYRDAAVRDCAMCPIRSSCVFPRLFDGVPPGATEPLDRDVPRPFVFRVPSDRRMRYEEGDTLTIEFVLIGWACDYLPYVMLALSVLADGGMGPGRGRFDVREAWSLDQLGRAPVRLDEGTGAPPHVIDYRALLQRAAALPADSMSIVFLTPTRLVSEHRPAARPLFYPLMAALRRRAEGLSRYHCGATWTPPHEALAEAASAVHLVADSAVWLERSRRSTRSDVRMPMSGFVGKARYEGDMRPFRALLALGELVHVGKFAAFGNGQMRCVAAHSDSSHMSLGSGREASLS